MEQVFFNVPLFKLEPIFKRWIKEAHAESQPQQVEQTNHPDKLLTVQEAAEFLHLSTATIYSKVSRNELPVCKTPGAKRLYFSLTELTDYVKAGRKLTNAEIEGKADQYLTSKNGRA